MFSFLFLVLENTFGVGKWSNYLSDIFKMGFYPSQSPAGFLWYLYVILFFYIITPIINYVSKKKYEWVSLGSSFEMNELSSAVLLSQLEDIDYIHSRRKEVYEIYYSNLQSLIDDGLLKTQEIPDYIKPNYHSFYILLKESNSKFINFL